MAQGHREQTPSRVVVNPDEQYAGSHYVDRLPEDPVYRVVAADQGARNMVSGPDEAQDERRHESAVAPLQ